MLLVVFGSVPLLAQDSQNTTLIGRWANGPCYAVDTQGDTAYVGNGESLQIMDFSEPANPTGLGQVHTPAFVQDVAVSGAYAYVADGSDGLYIIRNDQAVGVDDEKPKLPASFTLRQNYPNPFNPTTNIEYALPEASDVQLTVFNMRGQQVTTLVSDHQNAGWHTVQWNGVDNAGQQVSTDVYFYRITAGEYQNTQKMLYLK